VIPRYPRTYDNKAGCARDMVQGDDRNDVGRIVSGTAAGRTAPGTTPLSGTIPAEHIGSQIDESPASRTLDESPAGRTPDGIQAKSETCKGVTPSATNEINAAKARRFLAAITQGQIQRPLPQPYPGKADDGRNPKEICYTEAIFAAQVVGLFVDMKVKSDLKATVEAYLNMFLLSPSYKDKVGKKYALVFVTFQPVIALGPTPGGLFPSQIYAIMALNAESNLAQRKEITEWIALLTPMVANDLKDAGAVECGDDQVTHGIVKQASRACMSEHAVPITSQPPNMNLYDRATVYADGGAKKKSKPGAEEANGTTGIVVNVRRNHLNVKRVELPQKSRQDNPKTELVVGNGGMENVPLVHVGVVSDQVLLSVLALQKHIKTHLEKSKYFGISDIVVPGIIQ